MKLNFEEITLLAFGAMGYEGSPDFMENGIMKGIVEAFHQLQIHEHREEKISDTLVHFLKIQNVPFKYLTEQKVVYVDTERRQDITETEKARTDKKLSKTQLFRCFPFCENKPEKQKREQC
ncbi:MAG: hypothetical protein HC913_06750 [Microscillaceae bacterium]|nr:hypothetical protein [Microscillaceae bacterium]